MSLAADLSYELDDLRAMHAAALRVERTFPLPPEAGTLEQRIAREAAQRDRRYDLEEQIEAAEAALADLLRLAA